MTALYIVLLVSLVLGQIGSITVKTGVNFYLHDIVLLFVLFGGTVSVIQKRVFLIPRLIYPISVFVVTGIISLLFNAGKLPAEDLMWSSLYLLRWIMYGLLYVILVQEFITQKTIYYGLYFFGVILACIGIIQLALFPSLRSMTYLGWDPHNYRLFSTLLDPNFTGIILVLSFFTGIQIARKSKNPMVYTGEALLLIATYLTYSRSSYLALAAGCLFLICYYRKWKALIIIGICIVLIVMLPTPGGKTLRLGRMDSSIARIENWYETVLLIIKAPLTGYGFNTMKYIRISEFNATYAPTSRATSGIDSSLLFVLATTGIAGFGAYCWILYTMVTKGDMLLAVSLLALIVHSLFTNSMFYSWVMIMLWSISAASELTYDT